jgi:hypothetical protein
LTKAFASKDDETDHQTLNPKNLPTQISVQNVQFYFIYLFSVSNGIQLS